jgi:hypothetical protein
MQWCTTFWDTDFMDGQFVMHVTALYQMQRLLHVMRCEDDYVWHYRNNRGGSGCGTCWLLPGDNEKNHEQCSTLDKTRTSYFSNITQWCYHLSSSVLWCSHYVDVQYSSNTLAHTQTCTPTVIITDTPSHDEDEEAGVNLCSVTMRSKTLSNFQIGSLIQKFKHKQCPKGKPKQRFMKIKFSFMCLSSTKRNVHFFLTHLYTLTSLTKQQMSPRRCTITQMQNNAHFHSVKTFLQHIMQQLQTQSSI